MVGYIYMTINLINGKIYIGQKQGKKFNPNYLGSGDKIKLAIKKYGKENFFVGIIHKCDTFSMMDQKEIYYIKKYNSTNRRVGYNISLGGNTPMRGRKFSKKSLLKLNKIKNSPEFRKANSEQKKKYFIDHPEAREAFSKRMIKYYSDPEVRKIRSENTKQYFIDHPEARKAHSKWIKNYYKEHPNAGKNHSEYMKNYYNEHPEARKLASEKSKKQFESIEARKKNSDKTKEQFSTIEARNKHSEIMKQYYKDHPEKVKKGKRKNKRK